MDSFEIIINVAIIALLVPTIIFAYRLNRSLTALRENQNSLAKLIGALNDATNKAENSIPKLKSATEHSSEDLKEVVDNAKTIKDDLLFINQRADSLADRLEQVIHNSRGNVKDEKKNKTSAQILNIDKATNTNSGKQDEPDDVFSVEDSRSEAELELLKALRSIK